MARLIIPDEPTSITFTATAQSVFPISFALFGKENLRVSVDGSELQQGDFTFAGTLLEGGGYQGGTVTLNVAATGEVVIARDIRPVRGSNYAPSNFVPVQAVDQALNRLTAQQQDARRTAEIAAVDAAAALGIAETVKDLNVLPRLSAKSLSGLSALPGGIVNSVYLEGRVGSGDAGAGTFEWISGDQSLNVSADPLQGIWVAPWMYPSGSLGAWRRVFDGAAMAEWFGASSTADSASVLNAMASTVGYVRIGRSTRIGSSVTLDAPIFIDDGAYFTVDSGVTLSITNIVTAPNQWIFRGAGSVIIPLPDTDSGEDVRDLKAVWFGAFTQVASDQAPALQRAMNALGNSREGVVRLDCGSYQIESAMTVPRGVRLIGVGPRRTVFEVLGGDYAVFTTAHTACAFEDLQFENLPKPSAPARTAPYIHIKHEFCEVSNIFHQSTKNAIIVEGLNCKIRNIEGVYGSANPGAGSSQVLILSSGCSVQDIYCRFSTGMGPTSVVEIGTGATEAVTAFYVRNVEYVSGSIGVLINSNGFAVARGIIRDINYRGVDAVNLAPQVVKIQTSGIGTVFGVVIDGLIISNRAIAAVTLQQGSSGLIDDVLIDNLYDASTTGNGVELIQTAGTLRNVWIGSNVRLEGRANAFSTSGVVSRVRVAIQNRRIGKTGSFGVPASGIENGATYHVQSGSASAVALPATASEGATFAIAASGGGVCTLTPDAGATINGGATKALTANQLYVVTCTRNNGGSAAQWMATP